MQESNQDSQAQNPTPIDQEPQEERRLTKKEKRALRRSEKESERSQQQTKKGTKKIIFWVAGILVAGGGIYLLSQLPSKDSSPGGGGPDLSRNMTFEGGNHIGERESVLYQSNPPTSGSHWFTPLRTGVYEREKPDGAIIHSLEHGKVWVSYKPSVPEETKQALKGLLKGDSQVILTPRSANDTDIALSAWTRLDTFDLEEDGTLDEERILGFVRRYRNKGPEAISGNQGTKTYDNY